MKNCIVAMLGCCFFAHGMEPKQTFDDAVRNNDTAAVARFIQTGADVNARNNYGNAPLHLAAINNAQQAAELLIEAGARINEQNVMKYTPLHFAVIYHHPVLVKYLIHHKASVAITGYMGQTPLHEAVSFNFADIVQLFIDTGVNLDEVNNELKTPLGWAVENNNYDFVKLLLKGGAQVNKGKPLPLLLAVSNKFHNITSLLIAAGAHANGCLTLLLADPLGHAGDIITWDIVKLLVLAGYRTLVWEPNQPINNQDSVGATQLMYAAAQINHYLIKHFLGRGANPLLQDNYGRTVFDIINGILNNSDLELTSERRKEYHEILPVCYRHAAKNIWCLYRAGSTLIPQKPPTQLSRLPCDIFFYVMFFVTSGMKQPK